MKNFTILTHWASKCASICTINKNRYYLFIITMLFTLGVGSMLGAEETVTFTNKDWAPWTKNTSGSSFESTGDKRGVANNGVNGSCTSTNSYSNITKISYVASSNTTGGKVTIKVGNTTVGENSITNNNNKTYEHNVSNLSGKITLSVTKPNSKTVWVKSITIVTSNVSTPVDPTARFLNGEYTIGGTALDLSTLWESNSTGAVTYSVVNANGTGASITGAMFTATTAGNCTIQASQAAITGYNAITKTATITVSPAQGSGGSGSGGCTWELVTDASTLKVDDEVIIAASGNNNYAISTTQANNNRTATSITKNGNKLDNPSSSVQVLTLKAGSTTGTWAFYTGNTGYLYAASSSGNQLKTKTTLDVNGSWTITIENEIASIVATGSSNRNVMQYNYNNGSPLFNCYASASQTSLALYKKVCTSSAPSTYTVSKGTIENCIVKFSKTENNFNSDELTELAAGDYVHFTITPEPGYKLNGTPVVQDDNGDVECEEVDGIWFFEMPESNVTVSVSCVEIPKLATPTNLSASDITTTSATLTWEWNDNTNAAYLNGYNLYYKKVDDANFIGPLTCNTNSSNRTGLTPNTEYVFKVAAASNKPTECKSSDQSAEFTFKTLPLTQLATPTNLKVTNISCTGATLTWDNVANNNGYLLSVKNTSSSTTFNSNIAKDITSGSPTLNPGTTYTWKVVAKGDGTNYNDSEVADGGSFTTNYNITYDVKGGSWTACADGCVAGGEDFTICSTVPTKTGYNFMGWSTADDQIAEYHAEETIENVSANTTLYAVWEQPKYTVNWYVNGTSKREQTGVVGAALTDIPEPTTADCDNSKVFVGWTTIADYSDATDAPDGMITNTTGMKMPEGGATYHAVFANATTIPGTTTTTEETATLSFADAAQRESISSTQQVWKQNGIVFTNNKAGSSTPVADYINPVRCYKNSDIILDCSELGYIANVLFRCDDSGYANDLATSIGLEATVSNMLVTLVPTSETKSCEISLSAGQTRIDLLIVTYKKTIVSDPVVTYSNYSTTCVKLPDPVLSFETEPANPVVFTDAVCGGNSSKQSVTVVGENLRDVVNVSVTGPYKIARTASTALKDFTTSLTLDKTAAGAIHSNYQTVYIISTPPAQSTEATTGTLTFTTTKGNTLTVNLSTPTVTCPQYTLTLVDRGVSTEQATKYYAGETINEAPADPEGVCTDPIHYVFDGWAEATVAAGATTYTKVNFPYTVTGNTKFYAVYRYLEGGGNGDYNLVTSALDDWSGDYLIAYSDQIFANGKIGGKDGIGAAGEKVDLSSYITNNTIPAAEGDKYKVSLEAINGGYLLKTQDGKYNYQSSNTNGLEATTNKNTATTYKLSVNYVSSEEINLCLSGNALGAIFRYNTDQQGYFRFYKNGGQQPVYLYKKADGTTYYTTSPVCGPHLAITAGKEIYVTGGNAGAARDLVMASQKVSYQATRLKTQDGSPEGTAPDVKVATNGITKGGVVTTEVKVTFENTVKEQQPDDTYTITGDIVVTYEADANNLKEDIQVQLAVDYPANADARDNFTVHVRSLPTEFVIVAKQGDKWYALNADMSGSKAQPANKQIEVDDIENPTMATFAPCNTVYTFEAMPQGAADRISVRFIGMENKYLWSASEGNTGIQNNSKNPTADALAYNWKLYTEDNITYRFGNANSSRQLTLNSEKFGMYASGVQEFRILPYVEKCLYNYAPSNLKVSVLKGTYVTLTWDAVIGATKYQYRTDDNTWTDAGTEPTVTITGLTRDKEYTYYIRAYHEDAGVSQECIDNAEITFTTANCDDVPTDITYTADLNSITVSWTAAAPTATIKLFMNEDGTGGGGTYPGATSPYTISGGLNKNTTYYIQILSDGTCASPIIPVKTEDVEVDIVEWKTDGIVVDINTNETVGVTLENEVSYGSGLGTEATELFFSKYYEASYNVKLVAIYNGTKNIIDLTDYTIQYGKTSWETNYITLKDFGATKGQIQPGEEIILYSMQDGTQDDEIMDCVHEDFPDGNWVEVTSSNNEGKGILSFAGDKTLALFKGKNIIDIIGAVNGSNPNNSKANEKPTWGDAKGWICATGLSIADDSEIGISTNRCLLVRNNTVTSGANAVANNTTDFVTLCSEWKGAHVLDSDVDNGIKESCANFAYVGTFDYSDYYTKYVSMGADKVFDKNARNADGTVTIPITDLYKHACSNIRVKLSNEGGEVLSDREYKVPIMITTTQGTDGQAFLDLQQNLATKEVDGEGNVIRTYPLTLDEVREICKTCDVVVRDNATLMKMADDAANDHPQVRNVYVYENSSLIVPAGTNYTINNLSLRRKQDAVASVSAYPETLKLPESAAAPISLDFRLSAENWHWFTLPFDCNISEVTWVDGSPAQYNVDWFLMTYDGEKRAATQAGGCWKAYTGTTIKAGEGFILAINGNINNPAHTYELRFPMSKEVLAAEGTDKTVDVRAWGVETNIRPNHKGWNLVGNPYLAYYQRNNITNFEGLRLGQLTGPDPQTGYWEQTGDVPYVVVPVGAGWIAYEQVLASETDLLPFTAYFVQVGNDGQHDSSDELSISFDHTKLQLSATPMPASIIQRSASVGEEPVIVGVSLTNAKGESDKTSLVIDNQFTDEYEMNADFFKWFGDYYKYYTKPVLYTIGADQGKRAFNAISEDLATQPISLGMYAAQAGNYTFSLDLRSDLSKVQEVWLYDATQDTYTNLLQDSYTFQTAKTESAGRFFLSVKMAPKVSTDIDNVTDGTIWATTQDHTIFVNGLLSNAQLWIYDATGKLLHTDQTQYYQHTYQVPVSGTYFVRVQNTMQTQTIKVVVE